MKKIARKVWVISAIILLVITAFLVFQFQMPHRDVVSLEADYSISANELVDEYLLDPKKANQKYLDAEGDSKILSVNGKVSKFEKDLAGNIVLLLKQENSKAGIQCTFTKKTNKHTKDIKIGDLVQIKGVIRSGASYDADLQMYEDVILEKCDIKQSLEF
ncbi:hypothetical protein EWU23_03975 [Cytophagaceae bacterium 50C-KIRBA]|uniref:tRNA_anti-like n=1 Tax=Aquirufa beregesia TaxID=2516556 RepID=A0ABX0EW28_9BACT|nr:hypothetical protein [Aquirufa beregesia]NGZ43627.1 hypothetical protein [Aquirufa beregesia]